MKNEKYTAGGYLFEDEESLKAHIAAPHMARIGELKALYVNHTELQKMDAE